MKRRSQALHMALHVAAGAILLVGAACAPTPAAPPASAPVAPSPAPSPAAVAASPAPAPAAPATPASAAAADVDRLFIDMMVPHHEGAIEMARIAQGRVSRPELRRLVQDIASSQETEVIQLRRWRREWYGSAETPPMTRMPMLGPDGSAAHTMNMEADVVRLRAAPEPFERAFLEAMIEHHRSAVDAGTIAAQRATRPEIRDLAQRIAASQRQEIEQMRGWMAAWFGGAAGSQGGAGAKPGQPLPTTVPDDGHGGH